MWIYLKLFLSFAYIGAFTFGGGYSMLPMFRRVIVVKNYWLTDTEMTDIFSAGQCLPGLIAANTAVMVGYRQKGAPGSIVAALGVALPSIVIITVIAAFFTNFAEIPTVQKALAGLRVCVGVLIINTVIKLWKNAVVDKPAILIFAAVFLVATLTSLPIAILVAAAGLSGIAISAYRKNRPSKGGAE